MASIKRDNLFLLPKRHSSPRLESEFGLKAVKNWADNMSIGDIGELSQDLNHKLERLNRLDIPPLNRFGVLELLQTPLHFVLDTLQQDCTEDHMPLSTKACLAADMRLKLMVQSVIGYKTVLSQFHDDSIAGFLMHRHTRSDALHNVMFYLGEILFHSYLVFQPCLSFVWKELHGIYHYSVSNELHIPASGSVVGGKSARLNIEGLYKQILLLALSNPNSLLRGEVEKVHSALEQWTAATELVSLEEPVWSQSFFLIDAQSDAMPCASNLCSKEKVDVGWALITDDLDQLLGQKIKAVESACMRSQKMRPADAVSKRLMNKLRAAWTQQVRSREIRSYTSARVDLVCGLEPLYALHGGRHVFNAVEQWWSPRPFVSKPGHAEVGSAMLDNDEVMIRFDRNFLQVRGVMAIGVDALKLPEEKVHRQECVSTNKSENGYYLNWPENSDSGTHVGELVGVNHVDDEQNGLDVSLGVVRWMHVEQPGFLGVGVELLSGLVEPIILQCKRKGVAEAESMKAFLQHEGGGGINLITTPFYVDDGDVFRVVASSERQQVELKQIIESTDSFVRFRLE
ncbi:MAG: hypothetical protein GY814_11945 [Gammaproteobacteria bacterium]|nr:hypothetical protein [Gammaproteobacteria bacterium]